MFKNVKIFHSKDWKEIIYMQKMVRSQNTLGSSSTLYVHLQRSNNPFKRLKSNISINAIVLEGVVLYYVGIWQSVLYKTASSTMLEMTPCIMLGAIFYYQIQINESFAKNSQKIWALQNLLVDGSFLKGTGGCWPFKKVLVDDGLANALEFFTEKKTLDATPVWSVI